VWQGRRSVVGGARKLAWILRSLSVLFFFCDATHSQTGAPRHLALPSCYNDLEDRTCSVPGGRELTSGSSME